MLSILLPLMLGNKRGNAPGRTYQIQWEGEGGPAASPPPGEWSPAPPGLTTTTTCTTSCHHHTWEGPIRQ